MSLKIKPMKSNKKVKSFQTTNKNIVILKIINLRKIRNNCQKHMNLSLDFKPHITGWNHKENNT